MSFRAVSTILQIVFAAALVYALFFLLSIDLGLQWEAVWKYRALFLKGWFNTILISIASLLLSLCLGLVTALMQRSSLWLPRLLSRLYVEAVRGTPLLVQILFLYYVVAHHIGLENRYVAGVLILSIFSGAYIAETIRGGIDNVSKTQLDSARAIGLTRFQCYRFVIFPQAIRQVIPTLTGQFASIIKDSSLLSVIGISELTNSAQQINSVTFSTLETYLPLAIAYLLLTLPISLFSKRLERRFHYET